MYGGKVRIYSTVPTCSHCTAPSPMAKLLTDGSLGTVDRPMGSAMGGGLTLDLGLGVK